MEYRPVLFRSMRVRAGLEAQTGAQRGLAQTVAGIQRLKAARPDIRDDVARVLPAAHDEDVRAEIARIKARLP